MLEYRSIAQESAKAGVKFYLSSVPKIMSLPPEIRDLESLIIEHSSVEELFQEDKGRVCLLDPAATSELSPEDGANFDVFLFGGILGMMPMEYLKQNNLVDRWNQAMTRPVVWKKDPSGHNVVTESNIDRTSELRKMGFSGRRLGPIQMTTDTAVRVTRTVIQQKGERNIALTICALGAK